MDAEERINNAVLFLMDYGSIDGDHHKQWAMDQVVRMLTECPTVTRTAKDYRGEEYTYEALGESDRYIKLVEEFCAGEDGPYTYEWDEGTPP